MEFRPYQELAKAFQLKHPKSLCALPMGTGKTPVTLSANEELGLSQNLILAPANAIGTWRRHICGNEVMASMTNNRLPVYIVWGEPSTRQDLWRRQLRGEPGYYISTYDTYAKDLKDGMAPWRWPSVIYDEWHRCRNRKSTKFQWIKKIQSLNKKMLTGTAASRGAQDMWTTMNTCDPVRFSSYWRWVGEFCYVEKTDYGMQILGIKDQKRLDAILEQFVFIRDKKAILPELPPKERYHLPIAMTPKQAKMYNTFKKDMVLELSGNRLLLASTPLEKILRLRQMLTSPRLIDPNCGEDGAAIDAFIDRVEDMDEPHCVLFTPFTQAIPFVAARLDRMGYKYLVLQGGMSPLQVEAAENRFRKERCIALCSIGFAQSYSLSSATDGYFAGYDYDPNVNDQAEDRLHRFDTISPCNMWYFQHMGTVDDRVLEIINGKTSITRGMFKYVTNKVFMDLIQD